MSPATFTLWREALGGRRFLLTLGANAVNSWLFWQGKLTEGGYLTAFAGTVVAYIAANHLQKRLEKVSG